MKGVTGCVYPSSARVFSLKTLGREFSGGLVRRRPLIGLGHWPCRDGLVAAERVFGIRKAIGGAVFGYFSWVTAAVCPTGDRIWFWQLTRSWLCSTSSIALAAQRDRMGSRWMGRWDQVSLLLRSIGLSDLAMNFDGLGWCFLIDLKSGGWVFGGWIWCC